MRIRSTNLNLSYLCISIDVETSLAHIQGRELWNIVVLAFSLLFLQLVGDTANRTLLNTAHQVSGKARDLVA